MGDLNRLLRPRSVAIAGVSASPGSIGHLVLDNLERFGFAGAIHLIHPRETTLRGRACVASAANLPAGVDCVVLAIPAAGVLAAIEDCAAVQVGAVVIFSAGFAEIGEHGRDRQARIAAIADAAGMIIEGPNCLGFFNFADGIALSFAVTEPQPVHGPAISLVSQSGAMTAALRAALHARGLAVGFAISTGNEANTGIEAFAEYLLDHPATRVLALVAEHIRDPARFLAMVASARAKNIPVVMLHPGRSAQAAVAAATHTGAITGDHTLMRVISARAGVVLAETLEQWLDLCDILIRCPVRPSGGVAILGESGAFKAMMIDYADRLALDLPQPRGAQAAALDALAPGFILSSNPLDLTAQGLNDPALYGAAMAALLDDGRCGSLLVVIILSSPSMAARKLPPIMPAIVDWAARRCVIFAMLGEDMPVPAEAIAALRQAGVPFFRSPERALRALACFGPVPPHPCTAPAIAVPLPPGVMAEYRAKAVLAELGLTVARGHCVATLIEAQAAAAAIGFPVALKIQSAAIPHKSECGGVVLGLRDPAALAAGWHRLQQAIAAAAPLAHIDGVLVEAMAGPGLELILGARRDPGWGAVVTVGLGGVAAEALADVRVLACDLSAAEIEAELAQLRGAALLGAFRGRPARDVAAVAAAVGAIGRFMLMHPEVLELDVNPLLVLAEGEGALALDALMVCA